MPVAVRLNPARAKIVEQTLREKLGRLAGDPEHGGYKPLNEKIGKYLLADTRRRFSTKIGPDGKRWDDLSDHTERERDRADMFIRLNLRLHGYRSSAEADEALKSMYVPGDILVASGDLKESVRIGYVGDKEVEIRASAIHNGSDYAKFMQYGVKSTGGYMPGHKIPARPFLGFSEANTKTVMRYVRDYIDKGK